jgi:hypothetical protein
VPKLLLLDTLRVGFEDFKEVLTLLDLPVGIGMDDFGKILHQSEISSHLVSQSGNLAELRDQSNLISSLPVFVNEEGLVRICDLLIVPCLVVVLIGSLKQAIITLS